RYPRSDLRAGAEHVVGYLYGDGVNVGACEGVLAAPLEVSCRAVDQPVQDALGVGEEGVAALADEQPARAGLDRRGGGVDSSRGVGDENLAAGVTGLGVVAGGVVGGGGLPGAAGSGGGGSGGASGPRG